MLTVGVLTPRAADHPRGDFHHRGMPNGISVYEVVLVGWRLTYTVGRLRARSARLLTNPFRPYGCPGSRARPVRAYGKMIQLE
jgi:hypothetical protein